MSKIRHLAQGAPLPEWFLDTIQETLTDHVGGNFRITQASATSLQVVAGAGGAMVTIAVTNPAGAVLGLRHNTATASASVPGGLAVGTHDIYVIAAANSFANNLAPPPNELDNTDYSFGLKLLATGTTPSGTGSEAYYRKVGTFTWDGAKITGISTTVGEPPGSVPVGGLADYGGAGDPSASWLVCDGRAISRTTYAALFAAIGTAYGAGNGTTTFNIPDYRGRTSVGPDAGVGRLTGSNTLGASGGAETHVLTTAEMPSHAHGGATGIVGDHSHGVTDPGHVHPSTADGFVTLNGPSTSGQLYGTTALNIRYGVNTASGTTGISIQGAGSHDHGVFAEGGGAGHSSVQPYTVANKIIRAL